MKIYKMKGGRKVWPYWYPKRLTLRLPDRPAIYGFLWWNVEVDCLRTKP